MLSLLAVGSLVLVIIWVCSSPFFWYGKTIPWELPLPLFGSLHCSLYKGVAQWWIDFCQKWKRERFVGIHFFTRPCLVVKDPSLIVRMFGGDGHHFIGRGWYASKNLDPISRSVFFIEGDEHQNTRSQISPYFSLLKIKGAISIMEKACDEVDTIIENHISCSEPVDIHNVGIKYATFVASCNSFGVQGDTFNEEESTVYQIESGFNSIGMYFKLLIGSLYPKLIDIFKITLLDSINLKKFQALVKKVCSQRSQGIGVRSDFFQGMLNIRSEKMDPEKHDSISKIEIKDNLWMEGQLLTVFMAGSETISNFLAFLMYELAINQEIQEKMRDEVQTVFGKTGFDKNLINKLKYSEMVVNEILRLYPTLLLLTRQCSKDYEIDGFRITKGTLVQIPVVALHMDPEYFPEPHLFNPERFSPENINNIVKGSYLPFGIGPLICLGMKLSMVELMYATSRIISKYRFKLNPETKIPVKTYQFKVVTSPMSKIILDIEKI